MAQKTTQSQRVVVTIFNYNNNTNALRLKSIFEPYFKTYILDSGSNPPCPKAIHYNNIYYGGMFNEAIKKSRNHEWCCIITSDVQIADSMTEAIPKRMLDIISRSNVGCYQPSCVRQGRSHLYGYTSSTGNYRAVPYFEGWFQLFRTRLGFPVDVSINQIGWGTDLYLCKKARDRGLLNIVDDAVAVYHPHGTGFDNTEAQKQMQKWAESIPDFENSIKVGVGIICYEGTEHLRDIITEIRPLVDEVVLLWSDTSYNGVPASPDDKAEVDAILRDKLADNIVTFPLIQYLPPREQETVRRNQGLTYFHAKGIDYALIMDSDEFYKADEFASVKEVVRKWLPKSTYCYYKNYYKYKNCVLQDDCFAKPRVVPFLCHTSQRFDFDIPFPNPSDPTRRIKSDCDYFFPKETITMHHWSWIRKDIRKKILNWSAAAMFTDSDRAEMIDYYEHFDDRQTFVRMPHKIKGNKVEVKFE